MSLVADVRPSSSTNPSTWRKIKYSSRNDTPGSCPTSDHRWSATQARLLAPHRLLAIYWAAAGGCGQTTLTDLRTRPVPANGHDGCDDDRAVSSSRVGLNRSRPPVLIMIVTGMAPRRRDELGLNASGVRPPRRLQRGVAVERGARREAYRRSVSVGPGRGGVDRRVRHLARPRPRRHRGPGSPMGNGAHPSRMRSPPRPRRDRARVGARPVRDSGRAARLTPPRRSAICGTPTTTMRSPVHGAAGQAVGRATTTAPTSLVDHTTDSSQLRLVPPQKR